MSARGGARGIFSSMRTILALVLLCGCSGDLGAPCSDGDDCKSGYCRGIDPSILNIRQCVDECPCDAGQVCFSGAYCVPECSDGGDCPAGAGCFAGFCKPTCSGPADCSDIAECVGASDGASFCEPKLSE